MLKDGAEERIKKRLDKLKSHQARNYFLSNIAYPIEEEKYDTHLVNNSIKQIEEMLPKILELIKEIKKYFKDIYDQNNIVASYLLLGKAYKNLQCVLEEAKNGNVSIVVELCRSGQEALDLVFLFSEPKGQKYLNKWFKGEIISNKEAREVMDKSVRKIYMETKLQILERRKEIEQEAEKRLEYQKMQCYWTTLKSRLKQEGSESVTKCDKLKLQSADGKYYKTDVEDVETILRLVQSVPSPKAEPIKLWLAKVGYERIQETRNKLTDYWKTHDVTKENEYAVLTNIIHQEWSNVTVKEHKKIKNLKSENLRDHMTDAELVFTALAELSTNRQKSYFWRKF